MHNGQSRRSALAAFLGLLAGTNPLRGQRGLYFEKVRWFAWQPGRMEAREWVGILQVNAGTEKISFFFDHATLLDVQFQNIGSFAYENAAQPTGVEIPPKGWSRMKKKEPKHFLKMVYREARRGANVEADAEGSFTVRSAVFELPASSYGKVIEAIEEATKMPVTR